MVLKAWRHVPVKVEKASGKKASDITFKRFLGALVQDISE